MSYSRYFMTLGCEAEGYGHKGRRPSGSCILEARGNEGKLSCFAQDLKPETLYSVYALFPDGGRYAGMPLGPLTVDGNGKAQQRVAFSAGNILNGRFALADCLGVAVLASRAAEITSPLCGYNGSVVSWRKGFYDGTVKGGLKQEPETAREVKSAYEPEASREAETEREMKTAYEPEVINEAAGAEPERGTEHEAYDECSEPELAHEPAAANAGRNPEPVPYDEFSEPELVHEPAAANAGQNPEPELYEECPEQEKARAPEAMHHIPLTPIENESTAAMPTDDSIIFYSEQPQPEPEQPPQYEPQIENRQAEQDMAYPAPRQAEQYRHELNKLNGAALDPPADCPGLTENIEQFFVKYPREYPFKKQNRSAKWVRVDPSEQIPPPVNTPQLFNEPFVKNACTCHGHMLLGMTDGAVRDQYIIGVPDKYDPANRVRANLLGFTQFKPCDDTRAARGQFGYWLMFVNL